MKRIGILTAGGDTPALNATIFGAVEEANRAGIEVIGIVEGFAGLVSPRLPHVRLNPLFQTIPELDPCRGGTILGASRTYIDPDDTPTVKMVTSNLPRLGLEGLICIGGDGTINGMQPLSEHFPCVLAPKTIDNDLGLNYIDEPNDWKRTGEGQDSYVKESGPEQVRLNEIINYATPGYATAVFTVAQGVQRIRTTAESHRRIAIIEVMGRQSGYIALGAVYGQPDIILIPEARLNLDHLVKRVEDLYALQKNVVIVVGEGILDDHGKPLASVKSSADPAGNVAFLGTADSLKRVLLRHLHEEFFRKLGNTDSHESIIFTRKVGHTQRGGRPIRFDRFFASQLGGKAVSLLQRGTNNSVATLQWSNEHKFTLDSIAANKLRDRWSQIHPRFVHPSLYDRERFQPSALGLQYLLPIFTDALGYDDVEFLRTDLFRPGNLFTRYQSVNIDVSKRINYLREPG